MISANWWFIKKFIIRWEGDLHYMSSRYELPFRFSGLVARTVWWSCNGCSFIILYFVQNDNSALSNIWKHIAKTVLLAILILPSRNRLKILQYVTKGTSTFYIVASTFIKYSGVRKSLAITVNVITWMYMQLVGNAISTKTQSVSSQPPPHPLDFTKQINCLPFPTHSAPFHKSLTCEPRLPGYSALFIPTALVTSYFHCSAYLCCRAMTRAAL